MSRNTDRVKSVSRRTLRFFLFFPVWIALISGINIWTDAEAGKPFDFNHLWLAAGMTVAAAIGYGFCALIFKFVLVIAEHEEQRK